MSFGYCVLFSTVGLLLHTNQIKWPKATTSQWASLWTTWFLVTVLVLGIHRQLGFGNLRTYKSVLLTSLFAVAGFTIARSRERLMSGLRTRLRTYRHPGAPRTRVLIVGSGRTAEHIVWLMDHPTYSARFQVVGFIEDDLLSQGMKVYGSKVIGQIKDIQRLLKERDIRLIVVADNRMPQRNPREFRDLANDDRVRMVVAPDIFGALAGLDGASSRNEAAGNLSDLRWLVRRPTRQRRTWRADALASHAKSLARKSPTSAGRK